MNHDALRGNRRTFRRTTAKRNPAAPGNPFRGLLIAVSLAVLPWPASGAEPELPPEDLPHFPPVEPADVLSTFVVRPGFHLELAAHEPEVMDPIAISFDEQGRVYVVEMRDYSERRPERLGRVRRLEDRDGDGRYETATVYLDDLPWPTAVTCWDGGIFVGSTPDVVYAKDTDGDGRADVREVVFTGFASDFAPYATNKLNVQAMMNSLQWGLDCRIHGCGSMSGGKVRFVDSPFTRAWRGRWAAPGAETDPRGPATDAGLDLRGRDFSFDPRALDLRAETGGGQYGMSFDDTGRKFFCSNSDHLQVALYEDRYSGRDTGYALPAPRASIAVDGPAAAVFRLSPEEPWRVIRTRWRVTGLVPGLIEGGGRASGYFTSATGLTIYRGDAYGGDYAGDAFVADCGSNLIHRKRLVRQNGQLVGVRPEDEREREFIACRDTWFRPVQFANAPDGCLWVIDMYREIIEHPWSLPPNIKRLLDLNAGNDRGRLYRIAPDDKPVRRNSNLAKATLPDLVEALGHPNAWHRDTAARLLVQRHERGTSATLRTVLKSSPRPLARLHALYVLEALGSIGQPEIELAWRDPDDAVYRHAIRLYELHAATLDAPFGMVTGFRGADPDALLQMAFTLGTKRDAYKVPHLVALLRQVHRRQGQGLIADAALSSVGQDAPEVFEGLLVAPGTSGGPGLANEHLPALAELIGRRNREPEVNRVVARLAAPAADPAAVLEITSRLADGLRRAGTSLAQVDRDNRLAAVLGQAQTLATNAAAVGQLNAIRLVGHFSPAAARDALLPVLGSGQPPSSQRAVIEELLRTDDAANADGVVAAWARLAPEARTIALELLLRRAAGPGRVLDAIAAHVMAPAELSMAQLTALRAHRDAAVRTRATELLGAPSVSRDDAVQKMLPALALKGDASRGLAVHESLCATCHRLGGKGFPLGPDLESVRSQPKEKLLVAIVDPNREVQPAYLATTVETTDDEEITGMASPETAAGVTVRQANGVEQVVPKAKIKRLRAEGRSIMPEGFETNLQPQQLADLLAALTGVP